MSVSLAPTPSTRTPPPRRVFRTDIQALRALAITLVVLNHLWPTRLTGGYVGVDVFFVISGFLITGHLAGEINRTGRVRLGAFYARRVRRLLPAAFLVLSVALILAVAFLPFPRWERNAWEVAASAGYVENWYLAAMSVNYSALNDTASLVQHYWSLSVEEQFYFFWPLLLLAAAAMVGRAGRAFSRRSQRDRQLLALVVVVLIVGGLSLIASVGFTMMMPSQAYFATFTRGWEFAVGGAVALLPRRVALPRLGANVLSLIGFAAIGLSAIVYDQATAFPGIAAAAPVVGTAAVIVAGNSNARLWHTTVSARRPLQWVGGISYSLYLWHWPLIVVMPFVLGSEATTLSKLAILALSLALATVTKRFVEDGGQRWRGWRHSTRAALIGMVAGMLVIGIAVSTVILAARARTDAQDQTLVMGQAACIGPTALDPRSNCSDPFGAADYVVMTSRNEYFRAPDECGDFLPILSYGDKQTSVQCDFSNGAPDPTRVWLVGDSHAQQWQGAVFEIARDEGWVVTTSYMGGCPVADVDFIGFRAPWGASDIDRCKQWSHDLSVEILKEAPDLVITAMASRQQLVADDAVTSKDQQMADGMLAFWERWAMNGTRVLGIGDPPYNTEVRSQDCVLFNASDPVTCARPRVDAQPPDPVLQAGLRAESKQISTLDVTGDFCDGARCYAVVGKIPVYYDADHLNLDYVLAMRPRIESAAESLLRSPG